MSALRSTSFLAFALVVVPALARGEAARVVEARDPSAVDVDAERLEVDVSAGRAVAEGVRLSACGACGPPWTVSARRATLHPGGDVDLLLPVLRVGPVPVLALPWVRVRTGRQVGLLLPRVGYRSGGGFELGQGIWAPLGPTAELTAHAAWLSDVGGAELGATVEGDQVRLRALVRAGTRTVAARVEGRGWARSGPLTAAAAIDWTWDPEASRQLASTVVGEARAHEVSRVAVIHTDDVLQVAADAALTQGLRRDRGALPPMPLLGLGLTLHPVGAAPLWVGGRVSSQALWLAEEGRWPTWRTMAEPRVRGLLRAGPVLVRVTAASRHVAWQGLVEGVEEPSGRHLVVGGADLSVPLARRFGPRLRHVVEPRLAYRVALLDERTGATPARAFEPAAWPAAGHVLAVGVRTALERPRSDDGVELRATQLVGLPRLAGAPVDPRLDVALGLAYGAVAARLAASMSERLPLSLLEASALVDVAASAQVGFALGWRWLGGAGGPTTGPDPRADLPLLLPFETIRGHGLVGSLWIAPISELRIEGGTRVDLEGGGELLTVGGAVRYENRCGCLAASLQVWQRFGRPWPDVLLTADIGGLGRR